jgi:hypothetical protein
MRASGARATNDGAVHGEDMDADTWASRAVDDFCRCIALEC